MPKSMIYEIATQVSAKVSKGVSKKVLVSARALALVSFLSVSGVVPAVLPQFENVASANQGTRWQPPSDQGNAGSTLSGGRRGSRAAVCGSGQDSVQTSLNLLVPNNGAGLLTTSDRPTFAWMVNTQAPVQVTFILSHPEQADPVYSQSLQADRSGMVRVTLPETVQLETNVRYRWTVAIACNPGTTNANAGSEIYARSFIRRIANNAATPSPGSTGEFSSSALNRANFYAERGIWYDALGSLLTGLDQAPDNAHLTLALESLLQQAAIIQR